MRRRFRHLYENEIVARTLWLASILYALACFCIYPPLGWILVLVIGGPLGWSANLSLFLAMACLHRYCYEAAFWLGLLALALTSPWWFWIRGEGFFLYVICGLWSASMATVAIGARKALLRERELTLGKR
jgi:hypothetical protein